MLPCESDRIRLLILERMRPRSPVEKAEAAVRHPHLCFLPPLTDPDLSVADPRAVCGTDENSGDTLQGPSTQMRRLFYGSHGHRQREFFVTSN